MPLWGSAGYCASGSRTTRPVLFEKGSMVGRKPLEQFSSSRRNSPGGPDGQRRKLATALGLSRGVSVQRIPGSRRLVGLVRPRGRGAARRSPPSPRAAAAPAAYSRPRGLAHAALLSGASCRRVRLELRGAQGGSGPGADPGRGPGSLRRRGGSRPGPEWGRLARRVSLPRSPGDPGRV